MIEHRLLELFYPHFRSNSLYTSLTGAVLAVVAITLVVLVLVLTAEVVPEVKVVLVLRAPPLLTAGRLVPKIALKFWNINENGERLG